jgi:acetyl-CoA carboxylase carboxyl transferase subunit alpha
MQSTYLDFERPLEDLDRRIEELRGLTPPSAELQGLEQSREQLERQLYGELSPWYQVQLSRHPDRPQTLDYAARLFRDFTELHGDRCFGEDPAVVGGFAWFGNRPVMLVGHQRGRTTQEKLRRNFGMPKPEGYRKALRLFRLAERFALPDRTRKSAARRRRSRATFARWPRCAYRCSSASSARAAAAARSRSASAIAS